MAIAKMNRFTLLTFHNHKQALLKQLQLFGDAHLKNPDQEDAETLSFWRSDFSQEELSHYEVELEKVRFASERIAPYAEKAGLTARRPTLTFEEFDRYAAEYDYNRVYEAVKEQDEAIAAIKGEIARREAENEGLAAWRGLDIAPGELESLTQTGYLLGTVNKQVAEEFRAKLEQRFTAAYVELLGSVREDATLLALFPAEQGGDVAAFAREMGFTRISFPIRGVPETVIQENRRAVEELLKQQEAAVAAIRAQAAERPKLQIALDYFQTALERERARRSFLASDTALLMEGWIPADDGTRLRQMLERVCGSEYYLELEEVERESETVPIKLKNNAFVRSFESITSMYSMPRYNEIDPTPILAPFYWLFFGMMVGDVGYGLVIFLGTTVALRLLDLKDGMREFLRFFRSLSISVTLMGAVYGGVFGKTIITPIPTETGYKAVLDSQADITMMLIIAIIIGIVHILVGLGAKAYVGFRDGQPFDGFCDGILWMITLLSGIGWLVGGTGMLALPALVGIAGKWVFLICLVLLAATQGRTSPSLGGKIGNGLYSVYGLTSYVGDIVSYTRIVALALSGAYIAYAFNLMTGLVVGDFFGNPIVLSIIRLAFGVVIVVFGQALNLGLAMLGGYVHSCRLQYVEFFGKFYEGGGVVFRPLSLKADHIHITKS